MSNSKLFDTIKAIDEIRHDCIGGYYLSDDQQMLIVNSIQTNAEALHDLDPNVTKTRIVSRSLLELENTQSFLESFIEKYGINRISLDVMNNRVLVGVDEDSELLKTELMSLLDRERVIDKDGVVIKKKQRAQCLEMDFSKEPLDWSSATEIETKATVKCMPGGLIGRGTSASNITAVASVSAGVYYNGSPFFMTAGHGASVGEKMYYVPLKSTDSSYPTDYSALKTYNPSNRIYLGKSAMVKYGGYYDFTSVRRDSTCNLNMQGTAYNGIKPTVFGHTPIINEHCWYTGVANKRSYTSGNYVLCLDIRTTYVDERGKTMKDVIIINHRGNTGTSGGLLFNKTTTPNNAWNFAGTASSRLDDGTCFVKFVHVMNDYSLTPVFP